jgi:hypothetical protein
MDGIKDSRVEQVHSIALALPPPRISLQRTHGVAADPQPCNPATMQNADIVATSGEQLLKPAEAGTFLLPTPSAASGLRKFPVAKPYALRVSGEVTKKALLPSGASTLTTMDRAGKRYIMEADEAVLHDAIVALWADSLQATRSLGDSKKDVQRRKLELGENLLAFKKVLSKPGCEGRWANFLRSVEIPRTSADRLISNYEENVNPTLVASGPRAAPTSDEIGKMVAKQVKRLLPILSTPVARRSYAEQLTAALLLDAA